MITSFDGLYAELKAKGICKRLVAAWAVDEHTIEAAAQAQRLGFVSATLTGDAARIGDICRGRGIDPASFRILDIPDEQQAIAEAVRLVREGEGDLLMKGLCSTDKFLRAILHKENGLLPPKGLLCHVGVLENPRYHKLIFMGDMAVIPLPDFRQRVQITGHIAAVARSFGIERPKIAFIAATEQMLDTMPACMDGAMLAKMCDRGQIRGCIGDGPLAIDVALDRESAAIKQLDSPVAGDADGLLFPNLESSNVFWKTNSKLADGVQQAGMLVGAKVPCVLASRADDMQTKLNSIAEAVMFTR